MKLIDRYVAEVGKRLPLIKGRRDIENELRSTLEDMLEDRARKAGRPADEGMEVDLLREYGSPDQVAFSYNPAPYLIGPRMFPMFIFVLKIALAAVTFALLIASGVQYAAQPPETTAQILESIGKVLAQIVSAAIAAFGNLVLVFAILERVLPEGGMKDLKARGEWDPASLAREPDPDSVKRGELIVEIIFITAALVILNLYPQIIGLNFISDGEWLSIPILSKVFFRFVPWITLVGLMEIGLALYLLRKEIWVPLTRTFKIILEAASLAITIAIYRTPDIVALIPESFAGSPLNVETSQTLSRIFNGIFPSILILIMVIQGLEIVKAVYHLVRIRYRAK